MLRKQLYAGLLALALIALFQMQTIKLSAQVIHQVKFTENKAYDGYNSIISLNEKGLLYFAFCDKTKKVRIDHYSPELSKIKSEELLADKGLWRKAYVVRGDSCYTFLVNSTNFVLITTDLTSRTSKKVMGALPRRSSVQYFVLLGEYAYLTTLGKKPSLFQMDLKSGRLKELSYNINHVSQDRISFQELCTVGNEVYFFVNIMNSQSDNDIMLVKIDMKGKLQIIRDISSDLREKIIHVKTQKVGDKVVLCGTFSKTKSNFSQGIFFANLENNKITNCEFYNYTDLPSFSLGYTDKQQRVINRKKENFDNRNTELMVNTFTLLNSPKKAKNGYFIHSEFYSPLYDNMSNGIYTTHAVVAKFDENGKFLWDTGLAVNELNMSAMFMVAASESDKENLTIAVVKKGKIIYSTIDRNGVVINTIEILLKKIRRKEQIPLLCLLKMGTSSPLNK